MQHQSIGVIHTLVVWITLWAGPSWEAKSKIIYKEVYKDLYNVICKNFYNIIYEVNYNIIDNETFYILSIITY